MRAYRFLSNIINIKALLVYCLFAAITNGNPSLAIASNCSVDQKNLVGFWKLQNTGYFDLMHLGIGAESNEFKDWILGNPGFKDMTWTFQKCTVYINNPARKKIVSMKIYKLEKGMLTVIFNKNKEHSKYRQIKP